MFAKNNRTADDKIEYINIPTGASYSDVVALLNEKKIIADFSTFDFVAKLKKYPAHIKAGHYVFTKKMTNRQMVNMLRAGLQKPVKFVIYNIRTNEELAGLASRTLEIDSVGFLRTITSEKLLKEWNTDAENVKGKFIVANYEMYWNTSIEKLLTQMHKSYNTFWNESRLAKKSARLLTRSNHHFGSYRSKRTIFDRELKTVAGVYHNRLAIAMPLQADPTLVYATRDFDARRITNFHKAVESPYNTYKYAGLPP